MSELALAPYEPHLGRTKDGRRYWCFDEAIFGESRRGGWFAMRPAGGRWGLTPPRVDCIPTAERALEALEIYDAIIALSKRKERHAR